MKSDISPRAVIFDLDGVVVDTAHLHFVAWQRLAQRIGISIDAAFNEQLKGVSRQGSLLRILTAGGKAQDFTPAQCSAMAAEKMPITSVYSPGLPPQTSCRGLANCCTGCVIRAFSSDWPLCHKMPRRYWPRWDYSRHLIMWQIPARSCIPNLIRRFSPRL